MNRDVGRMETRKHGSRLSQQPLLSGPASPHALVDGDPHSEQPAAVLLLYFPARALGRLHSGSGYGHSRDVK